MAGVIARLLSPREPSIPAGWQQPIRDSREESGVRLSAYHLVTLENARALDPGNDSSHTGLSGGFVAPRASHPSALLLHTLTCRTESVRLTFIH